MLENQQMHFVFMDAILFHSGRCTNCIIAHQSVTYLHQLPFHISQYFHMLGHSSLCISSMYVITTQNQAPKNSF
jgi:hypothetical protein